MTINIDDHRENADWLRAPITALARKEGPLHRAADAHVAKLSVVFRYAFAVARKAIRPVLTEAGLGQPGLAQDVSNQAVAAMTEALSRTLPRTIHTVVVAGGRVGMDELGKRLRTAAFDPDQPRDEDGKWTSGYHGSPNKMITALNPDVHGAIKGPSSVMGTFLSRTELSAKHYSTSNGRIYRVDVVGKLATISQSEFQQQGSTQDFRKLRDRLQAQGFVGARIPHLDEIVVWHPHAMKIRAFARKELRTARDERRRGPFRMAFDVASPEAIAWADRHAAELIDGISETTREAINNAVAEALEEGDLRNLYDEILEAVGSEERAELIAKTEVMTAANEGQRQAWYQAVDNGLLTGNEKRVWIATEVGACPICEDLDGKTADLHGVYVTSDGDEYPGPIAHPRCRCTEGLA